MSERPEIRAEVRPVGKGASTLKIGARARISAWLANHQLVAVETLLGLLAKPTASLLTWLVIAIALTLPGALWMALDNVQQLSGLFQTSSRITLYVSPDMPTTRAEVLSREIMAMPDVMKTKFISADQALDSFRQHSGLRQALDLLDKNPLPAVILVEPPLTADARQAQNLLERLTELPAVDSAQLDMDWLQRLQAIVQLGERLVWVLGALLATAILLVTGNTIRLAIAARVDEIRVVKLVGGTNAYVRRPFLYTGLWFGAVGGLISWILLGFCWLLLSGPVADLAKLYSSSFELQPLSAQAAILLLVFAMCLGLLGAWWSVSHHLDDIKP